MFEIAKISYSEFISPEIISILSKVNYDKFLAYHLQKRQKSTEKRDLLKVFQKNVRKLCGIIGYFKQIHSI